jgi:hypothetical protein
VDESATGSVNFFGPERAGLFLVSASPHAQFSRRGIVLPMHLRAPSVDRGVQAFVWALVFFLILYFGMVAVDIAKATALIISLVSGFLIFLFVRTRGT